mgnify:CR=1 FL=1
MSISSDLKRLVICPGCGQVVKNKKNPCPNCDYFDCENNRMLSVGEMISKAHCNEDYNDVRLGAFVKMLLEIQAKP